MSEDNKATGSCPKKEEEDQELADLLNSALEDFSKGAEKPNEEQKQKQTEDAETNADQSTEAETEWTADFIRQAAEQFESNIANILRDAGGPELPPEQVQQSFQRMAEAAAQAVSNVGSGDGAEDADFASSISQALRGLSEGTENLQNPFSENDLMSMFAPTEGDQNAFVPFMQGMMQSLLSKEVLYPSLKDILNKYPAWMTANGGSLSPEDRHRYEQQQELMKQVCAQLEKESDQHTPDQKRQQFEGVLSLMQKLQDYGQPPPELVGDLGPGVPFNAQGNPECSLM